MKTPLLILITAFLALAAETPKPCPAAGGKIMTAQACKAIVPPQVSYGANSPNIANVNGVVSVNPVGDPLTALAPAPTKPKEIPAARQEAVSQVMLKLQQSQLQLQDIQLKSTAALQKAQAQVTDAQAKYVELEKSLRKEFSMADTCSLTIDKVWQCGTEPGGSQ